MILFDRSTYNIEDYRRALRMAAQAHQGQLIPGTELPYLLHLMQVWGEAHWGFLQCNPRPDWDANLLMLCSVLHDAVEDTDMTLEQIRAEFGDRVAEGVSALTKNETLPGKWEQMEDSLARIRRQPLEIWAVKIADRIVNLAPPPPHWNAEKCRYYQKEARLIAERLQGCCSHLEQRLLQKIQDYEAYCV